MFNFEVQCKKIQPIFISSCIMWSLLLLSEDLFWFNFFADFTDAELVSTHKNGKKNIYMLIIRSLLTFRQLHRFVVQRKSAKSGKIFKSWNFSFFDLEISLEYIKWLILNVSGAMKQEIANLYQLLWHVVLVFSQSLLIAVTCGSCF